MHPSRPVLIVVSLAAAIAAVAAVVSVRGQAAPAAPKKAPLVSVVDTRIMDIPVDLPAQGHIVPLNFVELRPQMTGIVMAVNFHEGDDVKAGQLLFTLDDSDARAQLAKADAQGALIGAQLADARRELQRAQALVASRFVAVSAADSAASKVDALLAQVRAAAAEASSARTALSHARIVAPIAGRAGAVAVHPGSLAQSGAAAPLVTLSQFSPIGVEFSLPEHDLAAVLAARDAGTVSVSLDGADDAPGKLTFINNTINPDSATINLKASFANPRQRLWPGGFARLVLHAGVSRAAVVLPPQAVQEGPAGRFVFLLGADGKVAARPVRLLRVQNEMAVIDGLGGGERVVLEGGANLRGGMSVRLAKAGTP
ncbi:MAG: efflux RND transporter periplasmic adaptor subunit [Pseudomonadota bacterium]|nr:efflux RND transporter periplasmic adaptor subunit [Pseudomonadota bacterium]